MLKVRCYYVISNNITISNKVFNKSIYREQRNLKTSVDAVFVGIIDINTNKETQGKMRRRTDKDLGKENRSI